MLCEQSVYEKVPSIIVLILILMEYALWAMKDGTTQKLSVKS